MTPIQIGLYFGSTTGATRTVAQRLVAALQADNWAEVELLDVAEFPLEEMADFDLLLLGMPTWNIGQMQRDWEAAFDELDGVELRGKHVALFGLGDQASYPDTFVDALIFLAEKVQERGARMLGSWPAEGYTFRNSWALRPDGTLVGLALDEETQPELTDARIARWALQLRGEYARLAAQPVTASPVP